MPGRRRLVSRLARRLTLVGLFLAAASGSAAAEGHRAREAPPTSPPASPSSPEPPPKLPNSIVPGEPTFVEVQGDKPLYVIHAPADNRRVLIYLHGLCGKVDAANSWRETATAHGTLIALLGDLDCPNGRSKWSKKTSLHHERIQRAIATIQAARGGLLDPQDLILIGYSQGAARASRLALRHPNVYSRLVLGGPPERPSTGYLGRARAIAVLGGELETTEYMRAGTAHLQEAGKLARYFMLPKARHGEYGPEAERVMSEVFDWLERVAPN